MLGLIGCERPRMMAEGNPAYIIGNSLWVRLDLTLGRGLEQKVR